MTSYAVCMLCFLQSSVRGLFCLAFTPFGFPSSFASSRVPPKFGMSHIISSKVVLVVRTVGNCTAFRLLDTSQVPVGVGVDSQSHSLEKDDIVAGEVRVVSFVCSSVNTSRAKQRLR